MADVIDLKPVFKADFVISPDVTYTADLTFETSTKDHTQLINRDVPDQHPISAITGLGELIPTEASADNQLADKDFVISNEPDFIGVFSSIPDLEAYTGTVTNNDHVFVENRIVENNGTYWQNLDELETYDKSLLTNFDYAFVYNNYDYDLYRFNILTQEWEYYIETGEIDDRYIMDVYNSYKAVIQNGSVSWVYEYTIENNELTYEQWEALQSGVTTYTVGLSLSAVQPRDLGNATITITQGGETKGTFTTNQKDDATIELDSGGGSVTDVTVDGVSVMNGTVAEIDLSGKQDALTDINAGSHININGVSSETDTVTGDPAVFETNEGGINSVVVKGNQSIRVAPLSYTNSNELIAEEVRTAYYVRKKATEVGRIKGTVKLETLPEGDGICVFAGVRSTSSPGSNAVDSTIIDYLLYSAERGLGMAPMGWLADEYYVPMTAGQVVEFDVTVKSDLRKLVLDGVTIYEDTTPITIPTLATLHLFGLTNNSSYWNEWGMAGMTFVNSVEIYDINDELLYCLTPVQDDATGKGGFFDTLTDTFLATDFGSHIGSSSQITPKTGRRIYTYNGYISGKDENGYTVKGTPTTLTSTAGTATSVANLFSTNLVDEQNITTGTITRRCQVTVLDGTEAITYASNCARIRIPTINTNTSAVFTCRSTHFLYNARATSTVSAGYFALARSGSTTGKYTGYLMFRVNGLASADDYKAWLKEQYDRGTPVVFLTPRSAAATETTTPVEVASVYGENTIGTTKNNIDNSTITVDYDVKGVPVISFVNDGTYQETLESGVNIKTINGESLLGSGNITIQGGGSSYTAGTGIDITNDVISVDSTIALKSELPDISEYTAQEIETLWESIQ